MPVHGIETKKKSCKDNSSGSQVVRSVQSWQYFTPFQGHGLDMCDKTKDSGKSVWNYLLKFKI